MNAKPNIGVSGMSCSGCGYMYTLQQAYEAAGDPKKRSGCPECKSTAVTFDKRLLAVIEAQGTLKVDPKE